MLAYVRDGDTVIVHSMDRLARNLDDLRRLVRELTSRGVAVEFVKDSVPHRDSDATASLPDGTKKMSARRSKRPSDMGGEIHMLVFLVGALLGALLGGALCVRYLRQEVAANIGPKIGHIQLQLDNIQAELNLAITTRHDTRS